jgi:tetratricopeptide (TPR) repeat protein
MNELLSYNFSVVYEIFKQYVPSEVILIYHSEARELVLIAFISFTILTSLSFFVIICRKRLGRKSWIAGTSLSVLCAVGLIYCGPPSYGLFCYSRGVVIQNKGEQQKGIVWMLKAIRYFPKFYGAYEVVSDALVRQGDYDGAVQVIKKYPRLQECGPCLSKLGDFENLQGNFEKAAMHYGRSNMLYPAGITKYKLACALVNDSKFKESIQMLEEADVTGIPHDSISLIYAKSKFGTGEYEEALEICDKVIEGSPRDSEMAFLKGEILAKNKNYLEAIKWYERGLNLRPRDAESHYKLGLLWLKVGDYDRSRSEFRRAFYYDNSNSLAFLLHESYGNRIRNCDFEFVKDENIVVNISPSRLTLIKGQVRNIEVSVSSSKGGVFIMRALLPYGRGVWVESHDGLLVHGQPGSTEKSVIEIKGTRASQVNLNKPWVVNFVVYDGSRWNSAEIRVDVIDLQEGRALLVTTQDQETGEKRNDHWDSTPDVGDLDFREVETDLIRKRELAERIANKHGIKWTHMVDIGSSLRLFEWAAGKSEGWKKVFINVKESLIRAYEQGNDIQLHIHRGSVPDSEIFEYSFDEASGKIILDKGVKERLLPGRVLKSWANVLPTVGDTQKSNTRMGSLWNGKMELERLIGERYPGYSVTMFRAGEWDFGESSAERKKSILALQGVGILSDSSATTGGSYYDKNFSFGRPPGEGAYFSSFGDITREARELRKIGILEMVPLIMPQGKHPVSPTDDPKVVADGYERLLNEGGQIRPGVHVIMEIEHISGLHSGTPEWDNLDANYGKWRKMANHFAYIKDKCSKLESVTATEAVQSWLDYYSPDPIIILNKGKVIFENTDGRIYEFDMRILGSDCLPEEENVFPVIFKIPSYLNGNPSHLSIFQDDRETLSIPISVSLEEGTLFELVICKKSTLKCRIEAKNTAL